MADLTPLERLQPALLDRLTDEEPDKTQESRERRVMSKARLRQAVLRDLGWLFNATSIERGDDFARAPFARRSVVNFGLPVLSGRLASSLSAPDLERQIREAIVQFEPRILPSSLDVRAMLHPDQLDHHNVLGVEIRGHLWAQPLPVELFVRTEIDLETGKVQIQDLLSSRGQ
jgi:type VI secretion system protein ImpF